MKNNIYKKFLFNGSFLIYLNALIVILNHCGLGLINVNESSAFINSDNVIVSMVFSALDIILIILEFLEVSGIINFIFFSIIVNNKILKELGMEVIILSTIMISLLSYFILYIPDIQLEAFWLLMSLKSTLIFSVLPALAAVFIKYLLWRKRGKTDNGMNHRME